MADIQSKAGLEAFEESFFTELSTSLSNATKDFQLYQLRYSFNFKVQLDCTTIEAEEKFFQKLDTICKRKFIADTEQYACGSLGYEDRGQIELFLEKNDAGKAVISFNCKNIFADDTKDNGELRREYAKLKLPDQKRPPMPLPCEKSKPITIGSHSAKNSPGNSLAGSLENSSPRRVTEPIAIHSKSWSDKYVAQRQGRSFNSPS